MTLQPPEEIGPWRLAGSYFEACSCEAICPCRMIGGRAGGRSTYGICDFALSWLVNEGFAGSTDLAGLAVAMVGRYDDDEEASPWRVALYVDERAEPAQFAALREIFLGRAGGTTARNFALSIVEVYAVRPAKIEIDHARGRERAKAGSFMEIRTGHPVESGEIVACGIPGFDHPGQEVVSSLMRVQEPPLDWDLRGRCGFATDFDYRSD